MTLSFRNKKRQQAAEKELNQNNGHGFGHVYENNVQVESLYEQNLYSSLQIYQNVDHVYECMNNSKQF